MHLQAVVVAGKIGYTRAWFLAPLQADRHAGAPAAALLDAQLSSDPLRALAHDGEPEPFGPLLPAESRPVVLDEDLCRGRTNPAADPQVPCAGVLASVGDGLLDDAEELLLVSEPEPHR